MKQYKAIIICISIFFTIRGLAMAGGPFGPPQSVAKDAGGLHTGIGYWHHEGKYQNGAEYVTRQTQIYSEAGYGIRNCWDLYGRIGISDLNVADALSSSSAATVTAKNDFEENRNFFGTLGAKGFYPFGKAFGMGAFIQGSYYLRDSTDDVSGTRSGAPFAMELRIQNLWDVNFGIGLQATVPYGIKMYLGPYVTYSEARVSPSPFVAGVALTSGELTIKNKTSLGGFAGIEMPLAKGFRLIVEGQYPERFSAGAAVTYSY